MSTTDKIYNVDTSDYNSLVLYIQKNETKKAIDKFKKMLPEYKVDVKINIKKAIVSVSDKSLLEKIGNYFLKFNITVLSTGVLILF